MTTLLSAWRCQPDVVNANPRGIFQTWVYRFVGRETQVRGLHCQSGTVQLVVTCERQLAPADTCYITVSYEMTVDVGLCKNLFTTCIARCHQLIWNSNRCWHWVISYLCPLAVDIQQISTLHILPTATAPFHSFHSTFRSSVFYLAPVSTYKRLCFSYHQ